MFWRAVTYTAPSPMPLWFLSQSYPHPVSSALPLKRCLCCFVLHRENLRWCYRREGVNHMENCKEEVQAYVARITVPEFGMLKGPSKFF